MPFIFTESHIADYMSLGYTVFRGIIPPTLIKDLRRAAEKGRQLAREQRGPQAQRIQPVGHYPLDAKLFRDYAELPDLLDAIRKIVGPDADHADPDTLGILLEPATSPWCTAWHRDITASTPGVEADEFEAIRYKKAYFNQVNCALYDDSSTWFVPGSHCRDDVESELAHAKNCPTPYHENVAELGQSNEELEMRCLEYCHAMPCRARFACYWVRAISRSIVRWVGTWGITCPIAFAPRCMTAC